MSEPKPTLKEDAAEYMRIQEEWIKDIPERIQEWMRGVLERSFYAGAASTCLLVTSWKQTLGSIKLDILDHMQRTGMPIPGELNDFANN